MILKQYLYIGAALAVLALGTWVYNLYKENQALKFQKTELVQNLAAKDDSIHAKQDSVTVLAASVRTLSDKVTEQKGQYIALENKYNVAIKDINSHGHGTTTTTDSTAQVTFSGKQSIASFNGMTFMNMRTKESTWSLSLKFATINVSSDLLKVGDIWKIKTWSLTPGVDVLGYTDLDEHTYALLQKYSPPEPIKRFAVGGMIAQDRIYGGILFRPSDWLIGIHYKLWDKNLAPNESWENKVMISGHYLLW